METDASISTLYSESAISSSHLPQAIRAILNLEFELPFASPENLEKRGRKT